MLVRAVKVELTPNRDGPAPAHRYTIVAALSVEERRSSCLSSSSMARRRRARARRFPPMDGERFAGDQGIALCSAVSVQDGGRELLAVDAPGPWGRDPYRFVGSSSRIGMVWIGQAANWRHGRSPTLDVSECGVSVWSDWPSGPRVPRRSAPFRRDFAFASRIALSRRWRRCGGGPRPGRGRCRTV